MPYTVDSPDLPSNVKKMTAAQRKQWVAIFNSTYASCTDDGGSAQTCETKAFQMANGVLKKGAQRERGPGMNWLTNMIQWFRHETAQQRALSLDNLMQKVYVKLYEMEDETREYYSVARLMVDEGGLWLVLNNRGKLYRTNLELAADGEVSLGAFQEVMEEYTPVQQNRVFLRRQADGTARVYLVAATAILNRVNEIDSRKLFDKMVQHAQEAEYYPAIDVHHLGPTNSEVFDIGYIDYLARYGVAYVASGVLDESKELGRRMAQALEQDTKGEWGCSIEYFALDRETIQLKLGDNGTIPVDVYTDGVNTRISLLPEQRAANWFTKASLKERSMSELTKDAALTLRKLFKSDEEFSAFIEQLGTINDEVEQRGLVHRETEATPEVKPEQLDPEGDPVATDTAPETPVERELVIDDATIALIAAQVAATLQRQAPPAKDTAVDDKLNQILQALTELTGQVGQQDTRLQKLERGQEAERQEWLSDLSPRLRERVVVTHRPTQAAGEGAPVQSAQQIADGTLAKIPNLAAV